jgi:hypothetical protein
VINGGCSDDGFEYSRGWLTLEGREVFEQAVTDPDALADLAVIRSAAARRAPLECESMLYVPAQAHRAATAEELPLDAYRTRRRELVGGWDFDDWPEMKRRLPRLTTLFSARWNG